MNETSHETQQPSELGPRSQAVIEQLFGRFTELDYCGHARGDFFVFWIATRPGMLLCDSCYSAAQDIALTGETSCTICGRPAWDPDQDSMVVAKLDYWLAVHFYVCSACAELDGLPRPEQSD